MRRRRRGRRNKLILYDARGTGVLFYWPNLHQWMQAAMCLSVHVVLVLSGLSSLFRFLSLASEGSEYFSLTGRLKDGKGHLKHNSSSQAHSAAYAVAETLLDKLPVNG